MLSEETAARFREYRRTGDVRLRNELVEESIGFADYLARRFSHRGEPHDDLRQVALIGLVKAVERFDPDRGVSFTTFAVPTITGEIKRHFRDRTWSVRVPRNLQELVMGIEQARGELGHALGRSPTIPEIAAHLDVSTDDILEGLDAADMYRTGSLDSPSSTDSARTLADSVPTPVDEHARADDRVLVRELLAELPQRERHIVYLRYFETLTQGEIAERVGVSQMHVSRLLAKSLEQLARAAEAR